MKPTATELLKKSACTIHGETYFTFTFEELKEYIYATLEQAINRIDETP